MTSTVDTNETSSGSPGDRLEAAVREYWAIVDGRSERNLLELFTDDVEAYYPKAGVWRGKEEFMTLAMSFASVTASSEHDVQNFNYIRAGETIVVEGTSRGTTASGLTWEGGKTPGGRFCSVFEGRDGLIKRMYVYLDPDQGNADAARYPWPYDESRDY